MRSQLTYEPFRDGIEFGVFDPEEAQKADNHNKNSAKSKTTNVPKRQFIPYKEGRGSKFSKELIQDGIDKIIDGVINGGEDN